MSTRYWRPGVRVYWRAPGSSQVGIDPRCAVVIEDLDPVSQALLERLPALGSEHALNVMARDLGVGRAPVRQLLDRLDEAGYLLPEHPIHDDPDHRYWQLAEIAGQRRPQPRSRAVVAVQTLDQIGLRIARILAAAGVGRLLLLDERDVELDDLSGDGYRSSDLRRPRAMCAAALLRATAPRTALTAPVGVRPDLVVLVEHGAVDPVRVRPLLREDQAHLPVLVRELDVVVGPLVRPGVGPCLRCLDLHRTDEDPRWPAVATQVTASPPTGTETSLAWLAAALTAHQVLAEVDGRGVLLDGVTLEISATYPLPRYREWAVHPECGCGAPAAVVVESTAQLEPAGHARRSEELPPQSV